MNDIEFYINIANEITSIRNHLWILTDDIPLTTKQRNGIEVIKERLFLIQEKLRINKKQEELTPNN